MENRRKPYSIRKEVLASGDVRYVKESTNVMWNFTRQQLLDKIALLQKEIDECNTHLAEINALDVAEGDATHETSGMEE